MTELEALEQLTDLVHKIEHNNWDGVYRKIEDFPFTPRTIRQEKEIKKLTDDKHALELENQRLRIKLGSVKNTVADV